MLREIKYLLAMMAIGFSIGITGFAIGAAIVHLLLWLGISAISTFWIMVLSGPSSILAAVLLTRVRRWKNG